MVHGTVAARLSSLLGLRRAPVAIAFRSEAPAGLPRVAKAGPAGCSYWTRAADGEAFYTEAADHENCPVGAHTHGIALAPAKAKELGAPRDHRRRQPRARAIRPGAARLTGDER
jgi:uncharacterized protein (DUF169 family)